MAKFRFDDKSVRAIAPPASGNRIDFDVPDPHGRGEFVRGFAVRTVAAGTKTFLLNYVTKAGRERRQVIGEFGPHTVTTAREAARKLRLLVDAGGDPYADALADRAAADAERARSTATLGALLGAYVAQLKAAGKPSWREVEASVKRNLSDPFPGIAALRADRAGVDDVMPVFRRLAKAGNWRAAEKLRAYLRAAYAAAKAARTSAGGFAFDGFDIRSNPMLELQVARPKEAAEKAATAARERKWALSEAQLRAYWKRLQALDTPAGALMRFHLLTGGQRMEQLSRLTLADRDTDRQTVTLRDTKGRRQAAHAHVVPLIPDAQAALEAMRTDNPQGPHLFTVSAGAEAAVPHTLAAAMRALSATMIEAEDVDRTITPGAIRRTDETRLAAKGTPDEVLARLLSHGLGGVQARNYNAHSYDDEKRAALETLRAMLDPPKGNVTPIRRRKSG